MIKRTKPFPKKILMCSTPTIKPKDNVIEGTFVMNTGDSVSLDMCVGKWIKGPIPSLAKPRTQNITMMKSAQTGKFR